MTLAFIDTETTGLVPDRHTIWEVALITPAGDEHVWQFPVDEMAADPFALNIGRYWERHWSTDNEVPVLDAIYEAHNAKSRRKNFPDAGRAFQPNVDLGSPKLPRPHRWMPPGRSGGLVRRGTAQAPAA